ncbi:MAG: hypothetical protein NXI24_09945 [bacterium]|nr:hypothetical protein [bacterium]
MFRFWRRYMIVLCAISILQGVGSAIAASPDPFGIYSGYLQSFFWGDAEPSPAAESFRRFIFAPLGGTLAGYFVLLLFIVVYPFQQRERWAHTAITAGILTWFFVDSSMTVYHGAWFNLYLVNLPTLALWSAPLIFTRRFMDRE